VAKRGQAAPVSVSSSCLAMVGWLRDPILALAVTAVLHGTARTRSRNARSGNRTLVEAGRGMGMSNTGCSVGRIEIPLASYGSIMAGIRTELVPVVGGHPRPT